MSSDRSSWRDRKVKDEEEDDDDDEDDEEEVEEEEGIKKVGRRGGGGGDKVSSTLIEKILGEMKSEFNRGPAAVRGETQESDRSSRRSSGRTSRPTTAVEDTPRSRLGRSSERRSGGGEADDDGGVRSRAEEVSPETGVDSSPPILVPEVGGEEMEGTPGAQTGKMALRSRAKGDSGEKAPPPLRPTPPVERPRRLDPVLLEGAASGLSLAPSDLKRSARRSKDTGESVLQSAIARKEKSFCVRGPEEYGRSSSSRSDHRGQGSGSNWKSPRQSSGAAQSGASGAKSSRAVSSTSADTPPTLTRTVKRRPQQRNQRLSTPAARRRSRGGTIRVSRDASSSDGSTRGEVEQDELRVETPPPEEETEDVPVEVPMKMEEEEEVAAPVVGRREGVQRKNSTSSSSSSTSSSSSSTSSSSSDSSGSSSSSSSSSSTSSSSTSVMIPEASDEVAAVPSAGTARSLSPATGDVVDRKRRNSRPEEPEAAVADVVTAKRPRRMTRQGVPSPTKAEPSLSSSSSSSSSSSAASSSSESGAARPESTGVSHVAQPSLGRILCCCRERKTVFAYLGGKVALPTDGMGKNKAGGVRGSRTPLKSVAPSLTLQGDDKNRANSPSPDILYCQAVDSMDGRAVGCCGLVQDGYMRRPSCRVPFLLLCEVHRQRLARHNCCPGCGMFCTQGQFIQCEWSKRRRGDGGGCVHHYHRDCELVVDDEALCPHCGAPSAPKSEEKLTSGSDTAKEIVLSLRTPRNLVFLPKQMPPRKPPPAKMGFTKAAVPDSRHPFPPMPITAPAIQMQKLLPLAVQAGEMVPTLNQSSTPSGLLTEADKEKLASLSKTLSYVSQKPELLARFPLKSLHLAARVGDVEKLLNVLAVGHNPNHQFRDYGLQTALHVAAAGGHMACVHLLVQAGAQLDATDRDHSTPLMLAVRAGHCDVVAYLVRAGACVTLKGSEGMTALHLASKSGNLEAAQELIAAGSPMSAIHQRSRGSGKQYSPGPLPQPRSFIDSQDDGGWTPLVWGCEHRHLGVVRFLLSKRADPLVRDTEQNIALHWSAFSGSLEVSEILLNHGCWVNCANAHGDTPLHVAARQNNYEVVVLLLARGARTDLRNREGETPLDCCFPPGESAPAVLDDSQMTDTARAIQLNVQLRALVESPLQPTPRILTNDISRGREVNPVQCVNEVDEANSEEGILGPPRDFTYISENCVTSDIRINRSIASLHSCKCGDDGDKWMNGEKVEGKSGWGCCIGGTGGEVGEGEDGSMEDKGCLCANSSVRCWYDEEGKLVPEFNFADPPMIFECNQGCLCNRVTCHNRVVQHGLTARMQLFRTINKGWGVRTLRTIPKGSYVCEYIGEIISDSEADQREDDSYLFDLDNKDGETYCIDARRYGNVARFINHMCTPNLQPVKVFVEHQDPHFPRIAFFANRDILPDEELGFDYGEKFWIIKCKSFTCTCGSENCRYSEATIGRTLEMYRARLALEEETAASNLRLGAAAASVLQRQQISSSTFVQVTS